MTKENRIYSPVGMFKGRRFKCVLKRTSIPFINERQGRANIKSRCGVERLSSASTVVTGTNVKFTRLLGKQHIGLEINFAGPA